MVDENLRQAMRLFSQASPSGEFRHYPGITLISSGFDYSAFNPVLLTSEVESATDFARRMAIAETHFGQRGLRWSLWLRDDLFTWRARAESRAYLKRRGYKPLAEPPGMAARSLNPPEHSLPELEIVSAGVGSHRLTFARILSLCFDVALPVAQEIYGSDGFWSREASGWLGLVGGEAVAVALVVEAEHSLGLYSVATLPEYRRRGYAERLVRHALEEARQRTQLDLMVLQSTREGLPLYQRLGFRTVCNYHVYLAP